MICETASFVLLWPQHEGLALHDYQRNKGCIHTPQFINVWNKDFTAFLPQTELNIYPAVERIPTLLTVCALPRHDLSFNRHRQSTNLLQYLPYR